MSNQVESPPHQPLDAGEAANAGAADSGATALAAAALAASLAACGGGGSTPASSPPAASPPTSLEASRFLAQSSMGADHTQISSVQSQGYAAWIDAQIAQPQTMNRCDWLVSQGFDAAGVNDANKNGLTGFDASVWRKLFASPDTLRQRVTLALSEILVVSIAGLAGSWRAFAGANYLDILENNAFGSFRTLLQQISTSAAMGEYLTYRGNVKANAATGSLPDENYARELMQLFTIGLVQLNPDGTPVTVNGVPQETYGLTDITGLARVFTGWDWDLTVGGGNTPDFQRRPMIQIANRHETGASTFLGSTVGAGLDGATSLTAALDIIFSHPNVAPFVSMQLIQRLVTSNPSPAYVQRVASVFGNDGSGAKGNLKAVVKAILLDDEARNAQNLTSVSFGKLREPMLRFVAWGRAFGATSPSDAWAIGDTSDAATRLGQSPLRSPTVFNFFRPGYVPPTSGIAAASLIAPEFQITNETSMVGYLNYMQTAISNGVGDVKPDYTALALLADNSQALLDELNLLLAAGEVSAASLATMKAALDTMASGTAAARSNRIYAALLMVMADPGFLVLK